MPPSDRTIDFLQQFVLDNVLGVIVGQMKMYDKTFQECFSSDDARVEVMLAEMKAFLGYIISTSILYCKLVQLLDQQLLQQQTRHPLRPPGL